MSQEQRFAAATQGEKTYSTGKPCKRGHLTYRYVLNGACEECVHPKIGTISHDTRRRRRLARKEMKRYKYRVNDHDLSFFSDFALGLAMMREHLVTAEDIASTWKPLQLGPTKWVRAFMVHPQDEPVLRALEVKLETIPSPAPVALRKNCPIEGCLLLEGHPKECEFAVRSHWPEETFS